MNTYVRIPLYVLRIGVKYGRIFYTHKDSRLEKTDIMDYSETTESYVTFQNLYKPIEVGCRV